MKWLTAVTAAAITLCTGMQHAKANEARPGISFNRWEEDWSVLADPDVQREPLDALKYIPLSADDPKTFLSLGANVRERFEANDAANFGTGTNRNADYLISRVEVHSDLRIASHVQIFAQLQSDFAPGKRVLTPVDQDRLDLEEAFITVTEPLGRGLLKVRVGRQQMGFDLQRFISVRDGPNVRQSYDAVWVDYERGLWRFISFYSHPVQNRDLRPFDDYSNNHLTYGGFRAERQLTSDSSLSVIVSRFTQDGARFPSVSGNERRNILDLHYAGKHAGIDWDLEAMGQGGDMGGDSIRAWAVGNLAGYTFAAAPWTPRLGLQVDAASGDKNRNDRQLNTFNPLFPNGYYVTLSGYTGYVNFIHVKPSITLLPTSTLKLLFAAGLQWRETTADAVYTQPDMPVPGTVGRPGAYTGTYAQFRSDWALTSHISFAVELVHFAIGDTLSAVGGHDSNYVGIELRCGW
jgi:Alginate export